MSIVEKDPVLSSFKFPLANVSQNAAITSFRTKIPNLLLKLFLR